MLGCSPFNGNHFQNKNNFIYLKQKQQRKSGKLMVDG